MTILVINWQDWKNPFAGGAELNLYEIFSRLTKKGHKVTLLCNRAKGQKRYETLDGIEIYRIGKRHNFNFFVPFAVRAILRHKKIDIITDDLNKIPFYSPFFTRKKVVALLHHLFLSTIFRETNPFFASYVFFTENLIPLFYRTTPFIAVSKSTAEDLKNMGIKKSVYIVYNGIPKVDEKVKESRKKNLVLYVGRLKRYKSIEHFIQAVAMIKRKKDIEAMIVGDGDAKQYLMSLASKLNLGITFTGFIDEVEKYHTYAKARVVVQPSIKEGFGLTAIEAQSFGTPVVCADSPGLREAIINGKTGYLYPYGNIEELSARIIKLFDDESEWRKFSSAAKKWASQFSWDNAAEKFEKILESLVS